MQSRNSPVSPTQALRLVQLPLDTKNSELDNKAFVYQSEYSLPGAQKDGTPLQKRKLSPIGAKTSTPSLKKTRRSQFSSVPTQTSGPVRTPIPKSKSEIHPTSFVGLPNPSPFLHPSRVPSSPRISSNPSPQFEIAEPDFLSTYGTPRSLTVARRDTIGDPNIKICLEFAQLVAGQTGDNSIKDLWIGPTYDNDAITLTPQALEAYFQTRFKQEIDATFKPNLEKVEKAIESFRKLQPQIPPVTRMPIFKSESTVAEEYPSSPGGNSQHTDNAFTSDEDEMIDEFGNNGLFDEWEGIHDEYTPYASETQRINPEIRGIPRGYATSVKTEKSHCDKAMDGPLLQT